MRIELKKFGNLLISRPAGKETWLAAQAYILDKVKPKEKIEVDFTGVDVLTPSWADEFISKLFITYPGQVTLLPSDNTTVNSSLKFITRK